MQVQSCWYNFWLDRRLNFEVMAEYQCTVYSLTLSIGNLNKILFKNVSRSLDNLPKRNGVQQDG